MIRTQIQLSEDQYKRLRERSTETRQSIAEQIREAITLYFQHSGQVQKKTIHEVAGKYKPIPMDDLKDHDQEFTKAILESKKWKSNE